MDGKEKREQRKNEMVRCVVSCNTQLYPSLLDTANSFNLIAIGLAIIVYKYGNPVLFKEYDERRRKKYEDAMRVRQAAQTAITSKKLFKK